MLSRLVLAALSIAALQVCCAGSEDWDWADPQTALWAIARENDIVLTLHKEAAAAVEEAAQIASQRTEALVAQQLADWQAPVQAAAEKAAAAGVNMTDNPCQNLYDLSYKYFAPTLEHAVPLCVVAARTQWDARVKQLRVEADNMLELIIKAQSDIKTCAGRPGELLQAMCRQTRLTWTVLTAQDNKSKKAVDPYWTVMNKVAQDVLDTAVACTNKAVERATFDADVGGRNAVTCFEGEENDQHK